MRGFLPLSRGENGGFCVFMFLCAISLIAPPIKILKIYIYLKCVLVLISAHGPSFILEEGHFVTYTAACHDGTIQQFFASLGGLSCCPSFWTVCGLSKTWGCDKTLLFG